jgi:hypothetical protein
LLIQYINKYVTLSVPHINNAGNHPAIGDAQDEAHFFHYNEGELCGFFVPGMTGSVTVNVKVRK